MLATPGKHHLPPKRTPLRSKTPDKILLLSRGCISTMQSQTLFIHLAGIKACLV